MIKQNGVVILKKEDDPLGVVRISMGGNKSLGYYVVYRGDRKEAIEAVKVALAEWESVSLKEDEGRAIARTVFR